MHKKLEELLESNKTLVDFLHKKSCPAPVKKTNPCVIVLAVIGVLAIIAGIGYALYMYFIPATFDDDLDDLEDELSEDSEEELMPDHPADTVQADD